MEFRHAPPCIGRLGIFDLPHPCRGATNLSTCQMANLRCLGPVPRFPWSLVKATAIMFGTDPVRGLSLSR
jgi:hypothetical protein